MPFFRPGPGPHALAIAMTGVRIGERLLYIGSGTPGMFGALAAKVGLSGHAAAAVDDPLGAAALKQGGAAAGALVDVQVASTASLPYDAESFDLILIDATARAEAKPSDWLSEGLRVLRSGGRLIVAERTGGVRLWGIVEMRGRAGTDDTLPGVLESRGFRPVRKIAERDGWRFTEGLKPRASQRP